MPDGLHVYLLDEAKNQHEGMTKEQIITAIENMETTGSAGDVDSGFISKILELNKHGKLRFWVGTMAEFNALESKEEDTLYLYTDDPTLDDIEDTMAEIQSNLDAYKTQNASDLATINSRLDDLGFSQAVVTITTMDGLPVVTPAAANKITKQGKRVILQFKIADSQLRPTGPYIYSDWHDVCAFYVRIPSGYMPKNGQSKPYVPIRSFDKNGKYLLTRWVAHWDENGFYIPTAAEGSEEYGGDTYNVGWDTD